MIQSLCARTQTLTRLLSSHCYTTCSTEGGMNRERERVKQSLSTLSWLENWAANLTWTHSTFSAVFEPSAQLASQCLWHSKLSSCCWWISTLHWRSASLWILHCCDQYPRRLVQSSQYHSGIQRSDASKKEPNPRPFHFLCWVHHTLSWPHPPAQLTDLEVNKHALRLNKVFI